MSFLINPNINGPACFTMQDDHASGVRKLTKLEDARVEKASLLLGQDIQDRRRLDIVTIA